MLVWYYDSATSKNDHSVLYCAFHSSDVTKKEKSKKLVDEGEVNSAAEAPSSTTACEVNRSAVDG